MKAFLLTIGMMIGTLAVSAQSYSYLTFTTAEGAETSMSVSNLKITFSDNNLVATNDAGTQTFALAGLQKMYFATSPATGIHSVQTGSATSVSILGGKLFVDGAEANSVSIYSLDGRKMRNQNLTRGAYIVRVNGQTYKVLAQ